ncbi:MAG: DNA cytosine methyltransferase [Myxococcota bacterium]
MRTLSVFSGVGGLDIAAEAAGLDVALATDLSADALDVLSKTTGVRTVPGDLEALLRDEVLEHAWRGPRPEVIIGGPPCTAFSHAGFWLDYKRKGIDPAKLGISLFLDVVERFTPRAFLMENVPGLRFKTHRASFNGFLRRARKLGYRTDWVVLSASDYGVPQARRRLFLTGVRRHGHAGQCRLDKIPSLPTRTVAWAIGDGCGPPEHEEVPRGKYFDLLRDVPPGGNYLVHTAERGATDPQFGYRSRYWSFLLKLHPDRPSPTIPAQRVTWNGPFHWQNRHLRVREMARLQGFPDTVPFPTDREKARRYIGNAVPVMLGAVVLNHLASVLEGAVREPPVLATARCVDTSWSELSDVLAKALEVGRRRRAQGADRDSVSGCRDTLPSAEVRG